jgi:DNA-binding NtrC family response regulator
MVNPMHDDDKKPQRTSSSRAPQPQPDRFAEPDFVDAVFAFILGEFPHLFVGKSPDQVDQAKRRTRETFGGREVYVRTPQRDAVDQLVAQVLERFNGRNATEVARVLQISRATVYRLLKQARRPA